MLLVRFPLRYRRKFAWKIIKAVAIWPVTGQDFQNTKRPAVQYIFFNNFEKSKNASQIKRSYNDLEKTERCCF